MSKEILDIIIELERRIKDLKKNKLDYRREDLDFIFIDVFDMFRYLFNIINDLPSQLIGKLNELKESEEGEKKKTPEIYT